MAALVNVKSAAPPLQTSESGISSGFANFLILSSEANSSSQARSRSRLAWPTKRFCTEQDDGFSPATTGSNASEAAVQYQHCFQRLNISGAGHSTIC